MWPSMGLNRAVIVVGGWDGECGRAEPANGEEVAGNWKDGGVASGRVVKRIPVDTAQQT
jgi:hypothetical protein